MASKIPTDKQHGRNGPNLDITESMINDAVAAYMRLRRAGASDKEAINLLKKGYKDKITGKYIKAGWLDKVGKGSDKARDEFNSRVDSVRKHENAKGKHGNIAGPKDNLGKVVTQAPGDSDDHQDRGRSKTQSKKEERAGEHWIEVPSRKVAPNAVKRRKILLDREGTMIGGDVPKVLEGQNISDKNSWNALTDPGDSEAWKDKQSNEKKEAQRNRAKKNKARTLSNPTGDVVFQYLADNYPPRYLNWVKGASWRKLYVPLEVLDMDRRPGGRDYSKVSYFEKSIKAGKELDPIVVVKTSRGYKIADGYHRTLAAKHAGVKKLKAYVASGVGDNGPWDKWMHEHRINKAQKANEDRLEALAESVHNMWMGWAVHAVESVDAETQKRWKEMFKPYKDLSEEEKQKDRVEAISLLDALRSDVNKAILPTSDEDFAELENKSGKLKDRLSGLLRVLTFKSQVKALRLARSVAPDTCWVVLEGRIEQTWYGSVVLVDIPQHRVVIGPDPLIGKQVEDAGYTPVRVKLGGPSDITLNAIRGTVEDQGIGLTVDDTVVLLLAFYSGSVEGLRDRVDAMMDILIADLGWNRAKVERFGEGVWERIQAALSKKYSTPNSQ